MGNFFYRQSTVTLGDLYTNARLRNNAYVKITGGGASLPISATGFEDTYNPNGNYKLCQEWGYEAAEKGHFVIGLFAGDYFKKELEKLTDMKNPRWWNVNYHVNKLYEEAVSWAEKVKDVENRTDEEKEYVENFLKGGK